MDQFVYEVRNLWKSILLWYTWILNDVEIVLRIVDCHWSVWIQSSLSNENRLRKYPSSYDCCLVSGSFIILDGETFEIKGNWEKAGSQKFGYDYWYQPYFNIMCSTGWGEPKAFFKGFDPKDVEKGRFVEKHNNRAFIVMSDSSDGVKFLLHHNIYYALRVNTYRHTYYWGIIFLCGACTLNQHEKAGKSIKRATPYKHINNNINCECSKSVYNIVELVRNN